MSKCRLSIQGYANRETFTKVREFITDCKKDGWEQIYSSRDEREINDGIIQFEYILKKFKNDE